MKKTLLSIFLIAGSIAANAQSPELSSWILNPANTAAKFWQVNGQPPNHTVTLTTLTSPANVQQVCYTNDTLWISATGLASVMGPFWNPGTPVDQSYVWKLPRNPTAAVNPVDVPVVFAIGSLINGVPVYGNGNASSYNATTGANGMGPNGQGIWNVEAWYSEGFTLDTAYAAHPQQQGAYHSHATPYDLYTNDSSVHSPLVGYAFDGFPIYGPFGYSSPMSSSSTPTRMESSYRLRSITQRTTLPDGSPSVPPGPNVNNQFPLGMYIEDYEYVSGLGDLDEHNGRLCVTPEYPNGTYAYFVTTTSSGAPKFPYYIGTTFYGNPVSVNMQPNANITIPANTSCFTTNVNEQPDESSFELFPNPAGSLLNIKLNASGAVSYELIITDVTGRAVISNTLSESLTQVDLGRLPDGIYMVILQDKATGARSASKLIKN